MGIERIFGYELLGFNIMRVNRAEWGVALWLNELIKLARKEFK